MKHIDSHIKDFLKQHNLIHKPLFVGVSGGADSMALLTALHNLQLHPTVLHVNFHLRGNESNQDQQFVQSFCKERGIECRVHDCNTTEYADERGHSIEMAARELRYSWFEKECGTDGILLIAHNADDVAETILLNQVRGTGILGLCGIREINGNIVRPLLQFHHQELLEYLTTQGIEHREDSTNSQNIAKRNVLRNCVFPILKELNPSVIETFGKNAKHIQGIEATYRQAVENATKEILSQPIADLDNKCNTVKINTSALMNQASPVTIAYEILAPMGFNEEQIASFMELCNGNNPGKQLTTESFRILFERNGIYITQNTQKHNLDISINTEAELEQEFETEFGTIEFQIINRPLSAKEIIKEPKYAYFDLDKIQFPLNIRNVRNGDRLKPFGMHGRTKLVSDILNDAKINSYEREKIPLLCDSNGIIWIAGLRSCEDLKLTSQTQRTLIVRIQCP